MLRFVFRKHNPIFTWTIHKWTFDNLSLYFCSTWCMIIIQRSYIFVLGTSLSLFKVYGSLMNIYLCSQCLYPVNLSYTSGIKAYSLQIYVIKFTCYIGSTGTWMISFLSTERDKCLWLNVLFSQLINLTPTIYCGCQIYESLV